MPVSPGSPDVAVLRARLEAAERLIGDLRDRITVMAEADRGELAGRDAVIAEQAGRIAGQADRIAQLERQVRGDSPSSSKPSSSDSPYKKKARDRSLRERTGRRPGQAARRAGCGVRAV